MSGTYHEHQVPGPGSAADIRTKALESLLIEKGILTTDVIDTVVLADGTSAIAELGFGGREGVDMVVLENTPSVHNVVVCTLCSCYPWPVLGLPPAWYKSYAYRSRVVREPRAVLREFGLELPETVEICVWDSNSDMRYMVLPERPAGTEHWSEAELRGLVTRDAMVGVARIAPPALAARS